MIDVILGGTILFLYLMAALYLAITTIRAYLGKFYVGKFELGLSILIVVSLMLFLPPYWHMCNNMFTDHHVFNKTNGGRLIIDGELVAYSGSYTVYRLKDGKFIVTNFSPSWVNLEADSKIIQVWTCKKEVKLPDKSRAWVNLFQEWSKNDPEIKLTNLDEVIK
jgi:hypothetical protein